MIVLESGRIIELLNADNGMIPERKWVITAATNHQICCVVSQCDGEGNKFAIACDGHTTFLCTCAMLRATKRM